MKQQREQIANLLNRVVDGLPKDKQVPEDLELDRVLRMAMGQPVRPALRKPYIALFREAPLLYLRRQAVDCIRGRLLVLNNQPHATDNLVDELLRMLLKLPVRGTQKVYEGIDLAHGLLLVTEEQLAAIAPYADPNQIERLLPHINMTLQDYDINTRLRQAHFLAQIAHESDDFNALEEYHDGSDYEFREDLGNKHAGDGVRFKGRGLIQITGRSNYEAISDDLGVDFTSKPRLLASDEYAAASAGWYWDKEGLNKVADIDDFDDITKAINGGLTGYNDRLKKLNAAKKVFGIK